jgi:hypothetical protein
MRDYTKEYRKAVLKAIMQNHSLGLPAYQCKNGYIIAIYPNGKEVKLQKATNSALA